VQLTCALHELLQSLVCLLRLAASWGAQAGLCNRINLCVNNSDPLLRYADLSIPQMTVFCLRYEVTWLKPWPITTGVLQRVGKAIAPSARADTATARSSRPAAILRFCEGRNAPRRQCRQERSERRAQTFAATACPRRVHARSLTRVTMSRDPKQYHWRALGSLSRRSTKKIIIRL
jgi:hypothetical protein